MDPLAMADIDDDILDTELLAKQRRLLMRITQGAKQQTLTAWKVQARWHKYRPTASICLTSFPGPLSRIASALMTTFPNAEPHSRS